MSKETNVSTPYDHFKNAFISNNKARTMIELQNLIAHLIQKGMDRSVVFWRIIYVLNKIKTHKLSIKNLKDFAYHIHIKLTANKIVYPVKYIEETLKGVALRIPYVYLTHCFRCRTECKFNNGCNCGKPRSQHPPYLDKRIEQFYSKFVKYIFQCRFHYVVYKKDSFSKPLVRVFNTFCRLYPTKSTSMWANCIDTQLGFHNTVGSLACMFNAPLAYKYFFANRGCHPYINLTTYFYIANVNAGCFQKCDEMIKCIYSVMIDCAQKGGVANNRIFIWICCQLHVACTKCRALKKRCFHKFAMPNIDKQVTYVHALLAHRCIYHTKAEIQKEFNRWFFEMINNPIAKTTMRLHKS